jgi:hypothetical protein
LQENEARRAQLQEGAEALVAWMHTRRAMWPEVPVRGHVPPALSGSTDRIGVVAAAPPTPPAWLEPAADAPVAPPEEKAKRPVTVHFPAAAIRSLTAFRLPTAKVRSLAAPILRWGVRGAVAAALVAGLAFGVSIARPYWGTLTARWEKLTTTPKTGTVVLESVPPGSEVLVDGVAVGIAPMTKELDPGSHVVEFRRRNLTRKLTVDVTAGQSTVGRLDWSVAPTGRLTVRSDPPGARVLVDGRDRGVTPVTVDVAIGAHAVVIQSDQGSIRRSVKVAAEGTALVSESIYSGWLKVFAPFEVTIAEGTRALRLDEQNQVLLPAGGHELHFENRALGFRETHRVQVEPGKVASLSLVPTPSTLTVTSTEAATVLIDGQQAGDTPLTDHPIALGTREVVVRSAAGPEKRYTTRVTTAPVRLDVDFSAP